MQEFQFLKAKILSETTKKKQRIKITSSCGAWFEIVHLTCEPFTDQLLRFLEAIECKVIGYIDAKDETYILDPKQGYYDLSWARSAVRKSSAVRQSDYPLELIDVYK